MITVVYLVTADSGRIRAEDRPEQAARLGSTVQRNQARSANMLAAYRRNLRELSMETVWQQVAADSNAIVQSSPHLGGMVGRFHEGWRGGASSAGHSVGFGVGRADGGHR
jgi:hypothetical protein